jgi:hypothetical protein
MKISELYTICHFDFPGILELGTTTDVNNDKIFIVSFI